MPRPGQRAEPGRHPERQPLGQRDGACPGSTRTAAWRRRAPRARPRARALGTASPPRVAGPGTRRARGRRRVRRSHPCAACRRVGRSTRARRRGPRRAPEVSSHAALSPAMPPPTTATVRSGRGIVRRSCRPGSASSTTPASTSQNTASSLSDAVRAKARPASSAHGARLDVHVVEDLEMVRDEPHGTHHHTRWRPSPGSAAITSRRSGPSQSSAVRPALCHATDHRSRPGRLGDGRGRLEHLRGVGVAAVDEARRDAVGGEDDRRTGARLGRELAEGLGARRVGHERHETRCQVPVLDHDEIERPTVARAATRVGRGTRPAFVVAHAGSGEVRREHEPDQSARRRRVPGRRPPPRSAGGANLAPAATTKRPGARASSAPSDRPDLRSGALVEWRRPSDGPVAAIEVGQQFRRRWAASPDLGVERGRARRASVGVPCAMTSSPMGFTALPGASAARSGVDSCTSSTMRASTPGSVSGSTPWPRLNMCPVPPPRSSTSRVCASTTSHGGQAAWSGRGCPAARTPGPTRRRASSSGTRQSTPTTSAPAPPSAQQFARPDAEVDPRHAEVGQTLEDLAAWPAGRGARSRRARAPPPSCRRAARRPPPPRPGPRSDASAMSARTSSRRPTGRVAPHERLGAGVDA